MNKRLFKILEIVGVPVIYLIASLLHFVYDLTDGSVLSILFGAVNESVWEHIKIFAVGYVLWTIIVFLWVKPPFKKYIVAKTISFYFFALSLIAFYYAYNAVFSGPILWLDLLSAAVFLSLAQYLSFSLTVKENMLGDYFPVAFMLIMLFFVMFFSFSVFPPKVDLFKDPATGMYGIIRKDIDAGAIFLDKTR